MKKLFAWFTITIVVFTFSFLAGAEKKITYQYNGMDYEGYLVSTDTQKPLVYIIHDWDGLTDYEIKRAQMLGKLGYNVFAIDLFGKGVKADTMDDRRKHT